MSTPNLTTEQIEFQDRTRTWLEANPAPATEIDLPLSQLELATREAVAGPPSCATEEADPL